MCMQCMTGAMTAGAAATGARCWLQAHRPRWMSERGMAWTTRGLVGAGLLASVVALGGAG
jgi:hypothetical protein